MKLWYNKIGEGKPVIILHGLFGMSDNWVSIAKRMGENHCVYIPDLRNHGRSEHHDIFNYYAMSDDLAEFIHEHNIKNPIIIGHSMGGKVAMHFAMEYPEMVKKMVIIDISIRTYPRREMHEKIVKAMKSIDFTKVSSRGIVEFMLMPYIDHPGIRLFIMKNLKRIEKTNFEWKLNLGVIENNLESVFQGLFSNMSFDKPVLFIRGGKSDYLPEEDFQLIVERFPKAIFQTILNATHWVHSDTPDELCQLLKNFLGTVCE